MAPDRPEDESEPGPDRKNEPKWSAEETRILPPSSAPRVADLDLGETELRPPGDRQLDDEDSQWTVADRPASQVLRIGRYRIQKQLGQGGQARVYLAIDEQLDRAVALKVVDGGGMSQASVLKRFQREAAIISQLNDPGICSVHDAGVADGVAYIAMEYIRGDSFSNWLKARWLPAKSEKSSSLSAARNSPSPKSILGASTARQFLDEVLVIIESVARSLQVAHSAGVIHRDIKSANIMMTEQSRPIVVDFGLARAAEMQHESLTISGDLLGTPLYMSPEQVNGQALDERSDVYSLGVVLFEAITNDRPFGSPTREGLYRAIIEETAPDVRKIRPELPGDLAIVVATALEKDLNRRYQSASDFADDLRRIRRHEVIKAKPISAWVHFFRLCQRNPLSASLTAAIMVLFIAGFLFTLSKNRDLSREREAAQSATYRANIAAAQAAAEAGDSQGMGRALAHADERRRGWEWEFFDQHRNEQLLNVRSEAGDDLGFLQIYPGDLSRGRVWLGGVNRPLRLIDTEDGTTTRVLQAPFPYFDFSVSPDGRYLYLCSNEPAKHPELACAGVIDLEDDGGRLLWKHDVADMAEATPIYIGGECQFFADGKTILVRELGCARLLETRTGATLRRIVIDGLSDHSYASLKLLTADSLIGSRMTGTQIASGVFVCDLDGRVIWEANDLGEISNLEVDLEGQRALIFSQDSLWSAKAGASLDGRDLTTIYDARTGQRSLDRVRFPGRVSFVGRHNLACAVAGRLEIYDSRNGDLVSRQLGPCRAGDRSYAVADATRIVTGSADGPSLIWKRRTTPTPWIASTRSIRNRVVADHLGRRVVAANWGLLTVTDIADGRLVSETCIGREDFSCLSFSPDSSLVAAGDARGNITIVATETGAILHRSRVSSGKSIRGIGWMKNNETLVLAAHDELLEWKPKDSAAPRLLHTCSIRVNALLLSEVDQQVFLGLGPIDGSPWEQSDNQEFADRGALLRFDLTLGRVVDECEFSRSVTAISRARIPLTDADEVVDAILVGDALGQISACTPSDLRDQVEITRLNGEIKSLEWPPALNRLLVGLRDSTSLIEMPHGYEVLSLRVPLLSEARFLAQSEAILFTQTVPDQPFGIFERHTTDESIRRRLLNEEAFLTFENARNRDGTRDGALESIAGLNLPHELRTVLEAYAKATVDNAAMLNSQAWMTAMAVNASPNDIAAAIRRAKIATQVLPDDWAIANTLSELLLRDEQFAACVDNVRKSEALYRAAGGSDMHPYDRALLVLALVKLGRVKEARSELDRLPPGKSNFDGDTDKLVSRARSSVQAAETHPDLIGNSPQKR